MRIAYIALHLDNRVLSGGVGTKIKSQHRTWVQEGHEAKIFINSPDAESDERIMVFRYEKNRDGKLLGRIAEEISRIQALSRLMDAVDKYKPDIIYLRKGLYSWPLHQLKRIAPVVVELNTVDVTEYPYRGKFLNAINNLTRGLLLSQASGFVAVGYEVAEHPAYAKFGIKTIVIGNGFDMGRFGEIPAPENQNPHLLFTGTPFPWQGADKLVDLAAMYPELVIDIVGYEKEDIKDKDIPPNINFYGFLTHDKFMGIYKNADIAVGTLALHRKDLDEISPLKVREYMAAGIPTVLPYIDTDLHGLGYDFLLEIPNEENNVLNHGKQIRDFAFRMLGKRVDKAAVYEKVDYQVKEKVRLGFFDGILGAE